jgi:predicted nucleotidyltransferase
MMEYDLDKLGRTLLNSPEVAAAYIFGSAITEEPVVNDLDILVLLYPGVDRNTTYFELYGRIAESQNAYGNQIDILFFDVDAADPEVLYEAVNKGVLLKNESPDLLVEKIEALTRYFVVNEFILRQAKLLDQERLEAFCEDQ